MLILKTISCFMLMGTCVQYTYAQATKPVVPPPNNLLFSTTEYIKTDSGLIINYYYKAGCKNYLVNSKFIGDSILVPVQYIATVYKEPAKPKLITIHGNISYDFFYRSKIDTPFSQQNLQQHTERVWLNILIKEKYPFKIGFTARQSNSPFYRDLYNTNLNFDRYGYTKNIKQDMLNRLNTVKWQNPHLKIIDTALKLQLQKYEGLKSFVNGPEALQRLIEEREKVFFNKQKNEAGALKDSLAAPLPVYKVIKLPNGKTITVKKDSLLNVVKKKVDLPALKDSLTAIAYNYNKAKLPDEKADSLLSIYKEKVELPSDSSFGEKLQHKKEQLNKLEQSIAKLKHQSDSIKNSITQKVAKVRQAIYKATNPLELEKIAQQNGIIEPKKEKLQNILANIKTLGIGRSMVDYTELTAQNVMLTGINAEYNPSYYAAFAAGKIDYGFRDFFGRGIKQKGQYLLLGRIGWGNKDKRTVILTLFDGRKNNYAGLLAADSGNNTSKLFGYSIETIIKKNENTFFSVEVAKSTKSKVAQTTPAATTAASKPDNLFKYNDDSNMGFNIKGQTVIPQTDTKISGFFRKTGEQFQSFSLFTYNTNQQMWQLRADQSFLKRKVNVTAMLRQNDFTNPLTDKTFKTSTVFKSLQLNVKVPRWPVINAGYYPGTQFYIIDNNTVRENVYYILNGSALYAYKYKGVDMNSSFIYNRYFNQATDSGFVLYKGINYIFSQALTLNKLQVEGSYSYNKQFELDYYTLDANGDYSFKKFLRLGGAVKYNHVQGGQNYWGQSIRISADFKKLGGVQLHYEKSYLPTIQQTLYPVEIGRVSYYKFF